MRCGVELFTEIPLGTILDDVFVPMNVVRSGARVVFEPLAIARDRIFNEKGKEFTRKVRTLTGNYQLLSLAPWLLSTKNPLLFRFLSHKILRLVVPLAYDKHAHSVFRSDWALVSRDLLAPNRFLYFSFRRNAQLLFEEVKGFRGRQHICNS